MACAIFVALPRCGSMNTFQVRGSVGRCWVPLEYISRPPPAFRLKSGNQRIVIQCRHAPHSPRLLRRQQAAVPIYDTARFSVEAQ